MNKEQLFDYNDCGRELEFKYNGKMYSITYGVIDGKDIISFCEFYKETTEVTTASDLLNEERNGISVLQMWESLTADNLWIY